MITGSTSVDRAFAAVPRPSSKRSSGDGFWRKESPHLGPDLSVIRGGLWPSQKRWWELPNFIKLFVGGYGCGKTLTGAKRIIASALHNAPAPVAAVGLTFPVARETIIAHIDKLLDGKRRTYGRSFRWKYNKTEHVYTIQYHGRRGRILLYSADRPERLVGPNLAAAWMDEPFLMDEAVFKQIIARVRHPDAVKHEIFCTGTPEGISGWGYDIVEGEQQDQYDVGMVRMSTRENVAVPDWYVGNLEGAFTEKAALAYIEGHFVSMAEGLVYYAFDPDVNIVEDDSLVDDGKWTTAGGTKIPAGAELGVGMDFNVDPMAFVVFWRTPHRMHVFREYELRNADTEYACQVLREEFPNRDITKGPVLTDVHPDASGAARKTAAPAGKSDFWYIREAGFTIRAPSHNPKRKDRYNAVNGAFRSKDGAVKLTISPKCRKLKKFLHLYKHEDINKPEQKARSHLLDALGYAVFFHFPVTSEALRAHSLSGW